jgi:L-lactate dehydrogenase complex protein LldE
MSHSPPRVALFVTCLVDLIRPSVGFATVKLLEDAGCAVVVPAVQTCCGQPAYNSGRRADTIAIARQVIAAFDGFDHVVAPSGSCAGMIKTHYPDLFADDADWAGRAEDLARRTHELTSFLGDVLGVDTIGARYDAIATYHDTCSGLRELGVKEQPRKLLAGVAGLTLTESEESETCCGFGGTFCVKYPDISGAIVEAKADAIVATGADTLIGGDLGCLMNMAGRLSRRGHGVDVRHVAEILVGDDETSPIGGI